MHASSSSVLRRDLPALLSAALLGGAVSLLVGRNFFGHGKKIRFLPEFEFGVEDPEFLRTMGGVLAPAFVSGNHVSTLQNGEEIFPAMLQAIREARTSVTFENFMLRDGEVYTDFANALIAKAETGVRVHFLQDAVGSEWPVYSLTKDLERSKVEVRVFGYRNLTRLNLRTHRKLLIIDGRVGFTGGAGISDTWTGDGDSPENWRDTHYRVEGPVVSQLQQAFTDNWLQTHGRILLGDRYFPELSHAGSMSCQAFQSGASRAASNARLMFLLSLTAAKRTIRIANAYFLPDRLIRSALADASRRGVRVEIMTPGERTDAPLVRLVSRSRMRPLLEAGVRIYEFQPTLLHSKYMVVDDCWVSVGSCNFDNRSMRLNDEANLNVLDRAFASEHIGIFEADKSHCEELTMVKWRRRPKREAILGRAAVVLRSQL